MIYIMLVFEIILFIIAYSISYNDIMSPSVISILFFIIVTFGIIYNIEYWNVSYSLQACLIVVFSLAIMVLSEWKTIQFTKGCRRHLRILTPNNAERTYINIPILLNVIIVTVLGFLTLYYIFSVFKKGGSLGATGLLVIGVSKYHEEKLDVISRLAFRVNNILFFIYGYIVANNFVSSAKKIRNQWINILPLVFGFCIMLFSGSRKLLVQYPMGLILIFVIMLRDKKGRKAISFNKLIRLIVPICVMIILAFYGMRIISKSHTVLADRTIMDYITYYISSPLYLFDKYLQNPNHVYPASEYFGECTFYGLYNSLYSWGLIKRGVDINTFLLVGGTSNMAGNEFSWFQRPYHDFGFFGLLIFTYIIYSIYNRVYYKKIICSKQSRKRDLYIILYAFFYFIVVLSFYSTYTITEFTLQSVIYCIVIILIYKFIASRKSWKYQK